MALDMSGTSFGGGDSPLVRFGFPAGGRRSGAAETAVAAHAPSAADPDPAPQVPSLVVGMVGVGHHKTRHN